MTSASTPGEQPNRGRLRWTLGWVVMPLLSIALLFLAGVHVGARRPDKPLARVLLWAFGGEAGVGARSRGLTASGKGWRMKEFEVDLDAADLHVDDFSRNFGLTLRLDPDRGMVSTARVIIRPGCAGTCEYAEFEDRLRGKLPEHEFEQIANSEGRPVDRVEWVQRPTEFDSGAWWWRMQSFDPSGSLVADHASVAFLEPRAIHFLQCSVVVAAPYLDRAEQLIDVCKQLEWRFVGSGGAPIEARFGGKYQINELELSIPEPPAQLEFDSYRPGHQVTFRGVGSAKLSSFSITSGCFGYCDPATLREALIERLQAEVVEDTVMKRDFELVHPVEEIARNRWRSRMQHEKVVMGRVAAIRPGAEDWIECQFTLWGSVRDRGDEFEASCLAVLADW